MMLVLVTGLLTGVYVMTLGSLAWEDVVAGAVVSSLLLWVFRSTTYVRHHESTRWTFRTLVQTPRFLLTIVIDVLAGTWQVTTYVVGLKHLTHPGIIKIPFEEHSQIRLGAGLLALTISPGSFVVDVNMEEQFILVHFIDISDPDKLRADIYRKYMNVPGSHIEVEAQEVDQHA